MDAQVGENDAGNSFGFFGGQAELCYRFVASKYLAVTADVQYMQNDLRIGNDPRGFILGLRFTAAF